MIKITQQFRQAITLSKKPIYLLAHSSGLHASRLSRILNGGRLGNSAQFDLRFRLLAKFLEFDGELFESVDVTDVNLQNSS